MRIWLPPFDPKEPKEAQDRALQIALVQPLSHSALTPVNYFVMHVQVKCYNINNHSNNDLKLTFHMCPEEGLCNSLKYMSTS